MSLKGKAIVAQSGGPTAVINASACGVIQTAMRRANIFTGVYGALNGILGVLNEEMFDLTLEDPAEIDRLKRSPSSALGSCRRSLKSLDDDRGDYERILDVFKAHDIRYFFYIGGNDSMDTAAKLGRLAREIDYDMIAVGVPKTIDNDLAFTDHCPGFGSVAKYSATTVMEAGLDTKALYTDDTCTVHEVMGRNAGWIAASTALARRERGDAPHIILLPEVPFDREKFVGAVKQSLADFGRCFVTCGEGVRTPDGHYLADTGGQFVQDSFGHRQLGGAGNVIRAIIESDVGVKAMMNLPGTAQRAAGHWASATDASEAYMAGQGAVEAAIRGVSGQMVSLQRTGEGENYACTTGLVDLEKVANGEKMLPPEYITADGMDVTDAFRQYALPLIAGQADVEIGPDSLPLYARLARHRVTKLTGQWADG